MSSFANNLASLARSKLRSTAAGSRDNLSLHRWVLLKNSITVQPTAHSHFSEHSEPSCSEKVADPSSDRDVRVQVHLVDNDNGAEHEFEEEEVGLDDDDSIIDEDMFAFLFPDPGEAVATTDEASEEQWLDTLLQSLGDDDTDDACELDTSSAISGSESECLSSPSSPALLELDEDSVASLAPMPISVPCPVPYPVCRPPFVRPFDLECRDYCYPSHLVRYASSYDDLYTDADAEDSASVPDAIEDTSDDETDRDSLSTPYSRSHSSLNLIDPALVPLPRDAQTSEPHIYSASESYDDFRTFEADQLPYHGYNAAPTNVFSPYGQTC